ncbi:hypothetical protein [Kribbella sp. NPDC004536]|uniref:hypothetical protein n=1 Tax=Kribbella sp. NPDC004536 TaxID=3364106 RepID=UPI0036BB5354
METTKRIRPATNRADSRNFSTTTEISVPLNTTGTVLVDLRRVADDRLRHLVADLESAPDGARVVVLIGDRWLVDYEAAADLRRYAERLYVDVQGTARAVARWLQVIRTGHAGWSV